MAPPTVVATTQSPMDTDPMIDPITGLPKFGPKAYQPKPLVSPTRTTAANAYSGIQSFLPNQGTYKPVDFTPIKGLDDNYYQSLTDKATKSLRKQYFDDDNSVMNQFNRTANQRGILGSGVEVGGMQDIYSDFGSQLADVTSDIGRTKAEKDYEVAAKNADMYQQNAFNNQKGQFDLAQLGIGSALDEAANQTKFDTDIFEQGVNYEKILADLEKSRRDSLTGLVGDKSIGNNNRQDILEQLFIELGLDPGNVGLLEGQNAPPDEAQERMQKEAQKRASNYSYNNPYFRG